jgi:hypothetical protein
MRLIIATIVITVCLVFHTGPARADLAVGQLFPNLTFSGTISDADRAYLGLIRPGEFRLKNIQAKYVLVEIFSDSCPHCMVEAPNANGLFRLIKGNPRLRGGDGQIAALKMMGVGFYGKPEAMEVWRIKHDVPFPLIPDPQAVVGKALDIPGTPTYVVLDRSGRVVFVHAGEMGSPQKFLRQILAKLVF